MLETSLRDGGKVKDCRLDRLVRFDERSRGFSIRAALRTSAAPRSYSWACLPHLDQGSEGACVGFAMTHELAANPTAISGLDARFAREKVYWEAQKIDQFAGGAYPGASPFSEGSSILAGIKILKRLGYVKEYRWAFSLDDLVLAVGHVGPVVLGIPWYEGMMKPGPYGMIRPTGAVVGGHAILCKGVNIKNHMFNLHNSWGTDWGIGGNCRISWDGLERLLHEKGEAVIPTVRTVPAA